MIQVGMHEATSNLSRLVDSALAGEEVTSMRRASMTFAAPGVGRWTSGTPSSPSRTG